MAKKMTAQHTMDSGTRERICGLDLDRFCQDETAESLGCKQYQAWGISVAHSAGLLLGLSKDLHCSPKERTLSV